MRIFVSYSRRNQKIVAKLVASLHRLGFDIWWDKALLGGDDWWAEIVTHIQACDVFIYALSPDAERSTACQSEKNYANALNKKILPIVIKNVPETRLPSFIAKKQMIAYKNNFAIQDALIRLASSPPTTMPDPMPAIPPHPISKLGDIYAELEDRAKRISPERQKEILDTIRAELDKELSSSSEIYEVLDRFINHPSITNESKRDASRLKRGAKLNTFYPKLVFAIFVIIAIFLSISMMLNQKNANNNEIPASLSPTIQPTDTITITTTMRPADQVVTVTPNPNQGQISLVYTADNAQNVYFTIINEYTYAVDISQIRFVYNNGTYSLSGHSDWQQIPLQNFPSGMCLQIRTKLHNDTVFISGCTSGPYLEHNSFNAFTDVFWHQNNTNFSVYNGDMFLDVICPSATKGCSFALPPS